MGIASFNRIIIFLFLFTSLFAFNGCKEPSSDTGLQFTSTPEFELNPSGYVPLAGVLRFKTNKATTVDLDVFDGTDTWTIEFFDFSTDHELKVLGLKPDRLHSMTITVVDESGNARQSATVVQVATDPLPANFPHYELMVADTQRMEPGITIVEGIRSEGISYLFGVNAGGGGCLVC